MKTLLVAVALLGLACAANAQVCTVTLSMTATNGTVKFTNKGAEWEGLTSSQATDLLASAMSVVDVAAKAQASAEHAKVPAPWSMEFTSVRSCDGKTENPQTLPVVGITDAGAERVFQQSAKVQQDLVAKGKARKAAGKKHPWGKD